MFAVLILTTVFGWRGSSGAQTLPPKSSGCTPNGNRFNLEALKDAVSQFGEYVAVLPNRGGHGADLVYGIAMDERYFLPPTTFAGTVMDAYYVQRDSSDCAADFESGFPNINDSANNLWVEFGSPTVVADPAQDAFFVADLRFQDCCIVGVGILKSTASRLLNPQ